MTENNPIELKSDDGLAKIIAQMGGGAAQEEESNAEEGKTEEQLAAEAQALADAQAAEENKEKDPPAKETPIDINKVLEEKTGGKFKSIEDLQKIIEEREKPKVGEIPTFDDDYDKLIWAASQKGDYAKVKEIAKLQSKSIDSISEKELLISKLASELKGLSQEELEDEYYERYGVGLKPLTEEEKAELTEREISAHEKAIREFERKRKVDSHAVKDALKSEIESKKNSMLDEYKELFEAKREEKKEEVKETAPKAEEKPRELTEEEIKAARTQFETEVKNILPKLKKVSIKDKVEVSEGVEEDLDITYELSEADYDKTIEYLADYELSAKEEKEFIKNVNGKEELDLEGLIQAKLPELFRSKLQKIRDKEVAARAREYVIKKDLKRVDLTPEGNTTRADGSANPNDFMKQWAEQNKNN